MNLFNVNLFKWLWMLIVLFPALGIAQPAILSFDPETTAAEVGQIDTVSVHAQVDNLWGYDIRLHFDQDRYECINLVDYNLIGGQSGDLRYDNETGEVIIQRVILGVGGVDVDGNLARMVFRARCPGTATIEYDIGSTALLLFGGESIPYDAFPGTMIALPGEGPDAQLPASISFNEDASTTLDLDDYVSDPNHNDNQLIWSVVSDPQHVNVTINAERVAIFTAEENWSGEETVVLRVEDPTGYCDLDTLQVIVFSVNDPPEVDGIPNVTFPEDGQSDLIDLIQYVTDPDNDAAELTWSYDTADTHLIITINEQNMAQISAQENYNGAHIPVTFIATDPGGMSGSDLISVTITSVPDPPVFTQEIQPITFPEDSTYSEIDFSEIIADPDTPFEELGWVFRNMNHLSLTINPDGSSEFSAEANWFGEETIQLLVFDVQGGRDSTDITVTVTPVNDPPVVSTIPNVEFLEDGQFVLDLAPYVTDPDHDASDMTWSVGTVLNVEITINGSLATFRADPDWNGLRFTSFTATDPEGESDTSPLMLIRVEAVNDPPVIDPPLPDVVTNEDSVTFAFDLDDYQTDIDNPPAELSWTTDPVEHLTITIDPETNETTITPQENWFGQESVIFNLHDLGNDPAKDTILVTVNSINDPPEVSVIPNIVFDEDQTDSLNLLPYVSDADHDPTEITWTVSGNNRIQVNIVDSMAYFSADPDWNGLEVLVFTATDPAGDSDSSPPMLVRVEPVNDPPQLLDIPDIALVSGQSDSSLDLDEYVIDVDHDVAELTWFVQNADFVEVELDENNVLHIFAPFGSSGVDSLTIMVFDPAVGRDSARIAVTVVYQGYAPQLEPIPAIEFDEDESTTLALDPYASDIDHDLSELTWQIIPDDEHITVSIDSTTHIATFSAAPDWFGGPVNATVIVRDPDQLSDQVQTTVEVYPVNDAPQLEPIPAMSFDEDTADSSLILSDYTADIDNDLSELSFFFSGNDQISIDFDAGTYRVHLSASPDWFGEETITVRVTDPANLSDSTQFTVTVNSVNDAPHLMDLPAISFDEDESDTSLVLDDYVSDVDHADDQLTWTVSGNQQVNVMIDANHRVTFSAVADWFGSETIQFVVTDPDAAADSAIVLVTVNPVNDAPVLATLPAITFAEDGSDTSLLLDDYVSDIDNDLSELEWNYSGNQVINVEIRDTRRVMFSAPPDWFGAETITFTVTDPADSSDQDETTVTVTSVNDAPQIRASIPDFGFAEDGNYTGLDLDDYATDVDHHDNELDWSVTGNVNINIEIDPQTHIVSATAGDNWFGSETVVFTVCDPPGLCAADTVTVTVNSVNDPPVISNFPQISFAEDGDFTLNLDQYVTDIDHPDSLLSWQATGQVEVTVSIHPQTRVATINAPENWNGQEVVTFTVTDPEDSSDFRQRTITVTAVNDPPVVDDLPPVTFDEDGSDQSLNLDDYVSDVDHADDEISWDVQGNQDVIADIQPDRTVIFSATPDWHGQETLIFTATDPGGLSAEATLQVTVMSVNDPPVVEDIPNIGFLSGEADSSLDLDDYVSDVDHDLAELVWSHTPSQSDSLQITILPDHRVRFFAVYGYRGTQTIMFTATDPNSASDSDSLNVTVIYTGQAPVITGIPDVTFAEDSTATLDLDDYVEDPDHADNQLVWTVSENNPDVSITIDPVTHVATFSATENWNGGPVPAIFSVTDPDQLTDSDLINVTVAPVNDPPEISPLPDVQFAEDNTLVGLDLDEFVTDVDHAAAELVWASSPTEHITVVIHPTTHIVTFNASQDWFGSETVVFTVFDPQNAMDQDTITVTVTPVNDPPQLVDFPQEIGFDEDDSTELSLREFVHDVDTPVDELIWLTQNESRVHVEIDPETGIATFTADPNWYGQETILFVVSDGEFEQEAELLVTVFSVNDPPVVGDIPDVTFDEDSNYTGLDLDNYVTDIDHPLNQLQWTATGNMEIIVSIHPASHIVTFSAPENWHGQETITFTVTDPENASDSDDVQVTVASVNDLPHISGMADIEFDEDGAAEPLQLDDIVSDVDHADSLLSWQVSGNVNVVAEITADRLLLLSAVENWFGSEQLTLTVTDPEDGSDGVQFEVIVRPVNDPPLVLPFDPVSLLSGQVDMSIDLDDQVQDVDNPPAEIIWSFSGNQRLMVSIESGNIVRLEAPFDVDTTEVITFTAFDGEAEDSNTLSVRIMFENQPPQCLDLPDVTFDEDTGTTLDLNAYVTDIDHTPQEITWLASTDEPNLEVNIDPATNIVTFSAAANWYGGPVTVNFTAADPIGATCETSTRVTVNSINDAPQIEPELPDQVIEEDGISSLMLDEFVIDVDHAADQLVWQATGNEHISVTISGERIATFQPDADWFGTETITFTVHDPEQAMDSDTLDVTVTSVNDPPVFTRQLPNVTFPEDGNHDGFDLDNFIEDVDHDLADLVWEVTGQEQVIVAIDDAHQVTFSVVENWFGEEHLTFTVTDPENGTASDDITVTVTPVNDPPEIITPLPDVTFAEDGSFTGLRLDDFVADIDDSIHTLIWSAQSGENVRVDISDERVVSFSAPENWFGEETVTFTVHDGAGDSDSDDILVTVTAVNDAPVFVEPLPDITFAEDGASEPLALDPFVEDVDHADDELVWTATGNVEIIVDISGTREVTFRAPENWFGMETITFTVTDPENATARDTLQVTVTPVNDPPVLDPLPDVTFEEDRESESIQLDLFVSDVEDADADLVWSYSGSDNLIVDISGAHILTIRAPENWHGQEDLVLSVMDRDQASVSDTITVTVTPVNDAPVFTALLPDAEFNEDESLVWVDLDDYIADVDGDELAWGFGGNHHVEVTLLPNNVVTFSAAENWHGMEAIFFTACDPANACVTDTVLVTVHSVNDPPQFDVFLPDIEFPEDSADSLILDLFVSDADHADSLLVWSVDGNENIVIEISEERIAYISTVPDWFGTEILTITVRDPEGGEASDDLEVTVTPVNDAPVIGELPDVVLSEDSVDSSLVLDDFVIDVDNDLGELLWSVDIYDIMVSSQQAKSMVTTATKSDRANRSLKSTLRDDDLEIIIDPVTHRVTFIPTADWFGEKIAVFLVEDPHGASDMDTIRVTVEAVNDPPEFIELLPDLVLDAGADTLFSLRGYVEDIDTPVEDLIWTATSDNDSIYVEIDAETDSVHIWSLPDYSDGGEGEITFTVSDGTTELTDRINVTILPVESVKSEQIGLNIPQVFDVAQNYPNPFNPRTTIAYQLPQVADVRLSIYDMSGKLVREWYLPEQQPGEYQLVWDGTNQDHQAVASGVYLYRLRAGLESKTLRMILLK